MAKLQRKRLRLGGSCKEESRMLDRLAATVDQTRSCVVEPLADTVLHYLAAREALQ